MGYYPVQIVDRSRSAADVAREACEAAGINPNSVAMIDHIKADAPMFSVLIDKDAQLDALHDQTTVKVIEPVGKRR